MKHIPHTLRRAHAWLVVYKLEIQLQDQRDALADCDDPALIPVICSAKRRTKRELEQAKYRQRELRHAPHRSLGLA